MYRAWLTSLVCYDAMNRYDISEYSRLCTYLLSTPYRYQTVTDGNRYSDGINLRYRFGDENDIEDTIIADALDTRDCSVFEMLVALAVRFEDQIMYDEDYGDRTGQWFWDMIRSLGLDSMTDSQYDSQYVTMTIDIFLNSGVLFDVPKVGVNPPYDIWWQLNRFVIGKEGV